MLFSSIPFIFVFLPALLALYYLPLFRQRAIQNAILLLASLAFYAWGESLFVFVMLFSIALNFFLALLMEKFSSFKKKKKFFLTICVLWNILLLFVFKYLSFFLENFLQVFPSLGIPKIQIALPLGISFFTFQILSYAFDIYYGRVKAQKNIFDLALYISLFPQLVAGPIVRYCSIENQIKNRKENFLLFLGGTKRFILGLSKKCLLSNFLAIFADRIFNLPMEEVFGCGAWIGAVCYSLQIYFDFSGYSDMAIGLGKMFGFEFEENFCYPYAAKSITDFWRRWHISLSSWFRDYVYIPLGGNRCSKARQIFNLFAVWALTGIWHGAAWTFWFWGVYYFFLLAIEKTAIVQNLLQKKIAGIFYRVLTLAFVLLGWVIFRSPTLFFAFSFIKKMFLARDFFWGIPFSAKCVPFILFCALASLPVFRILKNRFERKKIFCAAQNAIYFVMFLLCCATIIGGAYSPFIYFNF